MNPWERHIDIIDLKIAKVAKDLKEMRDIRALPEVQSRPQVIERADRMISFLERLLMRYEALREEARGK